MASRETINRRAQRRRERKTAERRAAATIVTSSDAAIPTPNGDGNLEHRVTGGPFIPGGSFQAVLAGQTYPSNPHVNREETVESLLEQISTGLGRIYNIIKPVFEDVKRDRARYETSRYDAFVAMHDRIKGAYETAQALYAVVTNPEAGKQYSLWHPFKRINAEEAQRAKVEAKQRFPLYRLKEYIEATKEVLDYQRTLNLGAVLHLGLNDQLPYNRDDPIRGAYNSINNLRYIVRDLRLD
ncbi:hypothetical protein HYY69_06755 [Candidatus Woesearchaeota archaeon]|nr:hypothetical protein [Candidatus Woesearchaeota archaeon]